MQKQPLALAFTGHRPESLPFGEDETSPLCVKLVTMIREEILTRASEGYTAFYCGAARGGDIIFGEQVLHAKKNLYPHIRLICVIPHEGQANYWNEAWRDRYFSLLEQASKEVLISTKYSQDCFNHRNRYMVDHATSVLAVFDGRHTGGTYSTMKYAYQRNKEIVILNPATSEKKTIQPRLALY